MGQQQLILLVLSAVIIGLAMVIGLDLLSGGARTANQDEVRDALMTIAARAQGWYRRPAELAGGGRSFTQIDFQKINFNTDHLVGTFTISNRQQNSFRVTGICNEDNAWSLSIDVYPDSIVLVP